MKENTIEQLREKIGNFINDMTSQVNNDESNEEKFNKIKNFVIEVGCKLFNKTKEDYYKLEFRNYDKFLIESDLHKRDRKLAANYLCLLNMANLYKNKEN